MSEPNTQPNTPETPTEAKAEAKPHSEPNAEPGQTPETPLDTEATKQKVIEVLQTIYDPEIPVSIYELGLVYDVLVNEQGYVDIVMTLTSPACPEAQSIPPQIEFEVNRIEGVKSTIVNIVWDPPWGPDNMSEAARLALGF